MLVPTICCGSITFIQICSGNTYMLLVSPVSYGGTPSIVVVLIVSSSTPQRYGGTTYGSSQLFAKIDSTEYYKPYLS